MQELSKSQKARHAIRTFKILADALTLQGAYKPSGKVGEKLADALKQLSPEIYGSMTDGRIVELKGLEYVIDRMPKGIENCSRVILTAQEDFQDTSFEMIVPHKRRRASYAVSEKELCFVITTGKSEIYDILTHITFLNIEAQKIFQQVCNRVEGISPEWSELESVATSEDNIDGEKLEQAIWNLSIILGRTYKETRETYEYLEQGRLENGANSGLFRIVYGIGKRVLDEQEAGANELTVYFTPSLHEMINHQKYASQWAESLKEHLFEKNFQQRPLHIISANMHSMRNIIYGPGALGTSEEKISTDLYDMIRGLRDLDEEIISYAENHGFSFFEDTSGSTIDINIIDLTQLEESKLHPDLNINFNLIKEKGPVLIVIDYAFGTQAFDIMDELLSPGQVNGDDVVFTIESISIMGRLECYLGKKATLCLQQHTSWRARQIIILLIMI